MTNKLTRGSPDLQQPYQICCPDPIPSDWTELMKKAAPMGGPGGYASEGVIGRWYKVEKSYWLRDSDSTPKSWPNIPEITFADWKEALCGTQYKVGDWIVVGDQSKHAAYGDVVGQTVQLTKPNGKSEWGPLWYTNYKVGVNGKYGVSIRIDTARKASAEEIQAAQKKVSTTRKGGTKLLSFKTEDGVELYDGDVPVWLFGNNSGKGYTSSGRYCEVREEHKDQLTRPGTKVFDTEEAAEKWLQQQNNPVSGWKVGDVLTAEWLNRSDKTWWDGGKTGIKRNSSSFGGNRKVERVVDGWAFISGTVSAWLSPEEYSKWPGRKVGDVNGWKNYQVGDRVQVKSDKSVLRGGAEQYPGEWGTIVADSYKNIGAYDVKMDKDGAKVHYHKKEIAQVVRAGAAIPVSTVTGTNIGRKVRIKNYGAYPKYEGQIGTVADNEWNRKEGLDPIVVQVEMPDGRVICPYGPRANMQQMEWVDKISNEPVPVTSANACVGMRVVRWGKVRSNSDTPDQLGTITSTNYDNGRGVRVHWDGYKGQNDYTWGNIAAIQDNKVSSNQSQSSNQTKQQNNVNQQISSRSTEGTAVNLPPNPSTVCRADRRTTTPVSGIGQPQQSIRGHRSHSKAVSKM